MATAVRGSGADRRWEMLIRPTRPWFDLRLDELWRYRDLVWLFVWRDFVAAYKQTILGPLWHIVQPIVTTLTLTVVFGRIAQLPTDGSPQFLFYMSGTIIWGYFATCLTRTSTTFISNANIFGKVYFPRLTVPLATVLSGLISLSIQLGVLLAILGPYILAGSNVRPNIALLLTPVLIAAMAALGLGLGIIVSALTTRYRDLQQLVTFGVQLAMYATPVIYPLSAVPERYQVVIMANPVAPIVETFRTALLGSGTINAAHLGYTFCCAVAILFVGLLMFNHVESTFMDTV